MATLLNYDPEKSLAWNKKAMEKKDDIIAVVDKICADGFSNIFFVGVGGTLTQAWSYDTTLKPIASFPFYVEHAADFNTEGNKKFSKDSVLIVTSATGNTKEVVETVETAKKIGARVISVVGAPNTPLVELADYSIQGYGDLIFYMMLLRFAYNKGDYPEYDEMVKNLSNLVDVLPFAEKQADEYCEAYARAHRDDKIQYLIGSGNLWGPTYSYAMCIMEEMQWMRTKSVTAGDFFHGTLEVIGRDDSVILFYGEDATRPQMERAEKFLHTICKNVTVFDTAKYELPGIDKKFRGLFSPIVLGGITGRIGVYLEEYGKHPMPIRRYYRKLDY